MIDFHAYPVRIKELVSEDPALQSNIENIFSYFFPAQPLEVILNEMNSAGVEQQVLMPIDCTSAHNCTIATNEQIADIVKKVPDRFIGFASVDPHLPDAAEKLEYAVSSLGLKGLKLEPSLQYFYPDNLQLLAPVYEMCQKLDIPVSIDCGLHWSMLANEKYASPMRLLDVLHTYGDLKVVIPHLGWPWVDETIMLALKYRNVYVDTSVVSVGIPTRTLSRIMEERISMETFEQSLFERTLFASNYPRVDLRRTVRAVGALNMSPGFRQRFYQKNAEELLKLKG